MVGCHPLLPLLLLLLVEAVKYQVVEYSRKKRDRMLQTLDGELDEGSSKID